MTDSFHLSFSNLERDLYLFLKSMPDASAFLKSAIKTHMMQKNAGTVDNDLPYVEKYQAEHIKNLFNRVYGDIMQGGIRQFLFLMDNNPVNIKTAMQGRNVTLLGICQNDLVLVEKVTEYAKIQLPALKEYI